MALRLSQSVLAAFVLSACSIIPTPRVTPGELTVTASPAEIYLVRGPGGQHLNFEFIIANGTDDKLALNKIELSVLDDSGKLVRREFYDEFARPALELRPTRTLKSSRRMTVFNPFHTLASEIPVATLRFELSFRTSNREKEVKRTVDVKPVVYQTKTDLILPMRGRVLVWDGHDYASHHRRNIIEGYGAGRFSYDFVLVDEQGQIYKGRPRSNDDWYKQRPDSMEEYYSFGAPVYAAGAGRVVLVRDSRADDRTWSSSESDENAGAGNYIVIDHLNGEFSAFAHIKQGSAKVKVGQMVKQGEIIAAVGASGSSLFPHLDYQLRTGPGTKNVEGLPSTFTTFRRIMGSRSVDVSRGTINTGDLVDWQAPLR